MERLSALYVPRLVQRVPLNFSWPQFRRYEGPPLPTGNGWQLWETFPELACPISPVFNRAEGLAIWCSSHVTANYEVPIPGFPIELGYHNDVVGPWTPEEWLTLVMRVSGSRGPASVSVGIAAFRDEWILLFPFD